jgi:hypothetical protein
MLRLRSTSCFRSESRISDLLSRGTFRRQGGNEDRGVADAVGWFAVQMSSESFDGVNAARCGAPSGARGATTLSYSGGIVGGEAQGGDGFGTAVAADTLLESVPFGRASRLCNASNSIHVTGRLQSAGRSRT